MRTRKPTQEEIQKFEDLKNNSEFLAEAERLRKAHFVNWTWNCSDEVFNRWKDFSNGWIAEIAAAGFAIAHRHGLRVIIG